MQSVQVIQNSGSATESVIHQKIREKINISSAEPEHLTYKIAGSIHEIEAAYRLTHDSYVKKGYISPIPSGLKLNIFNALPNTATFIGLENEVVCSTISLLPDSPLGLPMDCIYKQETDRLRQKGRFIVEVSSLVSTLNSQYNVIYIAKLIFLYARDFLKADDLVCAVHPRHQTFYESVLCYKKFGTIKSYSNVNNNPAVALHLDLHSFEQTTLETFARNPVEKDLHHFFFVNNTPSIQLPPTKQPLMVWNKHRLNYFFNLKTSIFRDMDSTTREIMHKIYSKNIIG